MGSKEAEVFFGFSVSYPPAGCPTLGLCVDLQQHKKKANQNMFDRARVLGPQRVRVLHSHMSGIPCTKHNLLINKSAMSFPLALGEDSF